MVFDIYDNNKNQGTKDSVHMSVRNKLLPLYKTFYVVIH